MKHLFLVIALTIPLLSKSQTTLLGFSRYYIAVTWGNIHPEYKTVSSNPDMLCLKDTLSEKMIRFDFNNQNPQTVNKITVSFLKEGDAIAAFYEYSLAGWKEISTTLLYNKPTNEAVSLIIEGRAYLLMFFKND